MTILVDTNVLLSAAIRDRLPERVIEAIAARDDWTWMATPQIEAEYRDVLARPKFKIPQPHYDHWLQFLEANVRLFDPSATVPDFPRDPKDVPFLLAALASQADYLITGDKDLLEAQHLVPTRIVTVAEFAHLFGIP